MNHLEKRISISPNKVNTTYYDSLAFGVLFRTLEEAYTFALSESNCRSFEVCEVQGRSSGKTMFLIGKYSNKRIVKRKEMKGKIQ